MAFSGGLVLADALKAFPIADAYGSGFTACLLASGSFVLSITCGGSCLALAGTGCLFAGADAPALPRLGSFGGALYVDPLPRGAGMVSVAGGSEAMSFGGGGGGGFLYGGKVGATLAPGLRGATKIGGGALGPGDRQTRMDCHQSQGLSLTTTGTSPEAALIGKPSCGFQAVWKGQDKPSQNPAAGCVVTGPTGAKLP